MKKVVEGFLKFWPIVVVGLSAIVFVLQLSGRVNVMESSLTMLREQVEKTCTKMESMASEVSRIREDVAFIRGGQRMSSAPVASAGGGW